MCMGWKEAILSNVHMLEKGGFQEEKGRFQLCAHVGKRWISATCTCCKVVGWKEVSFSNVHALERD